jgi:hypothetical protein
MATKRTRLLFTCRFDEVAPLAHLLWASYQLDEPDFAELLPEDYNAGFAKAYNAALVAVEQLVASWVQRAKGTAFTAELAALYEALPNLLNRLEARVRRAKGLTVPAKKLGIGAERTARNQEDPEALADDLKTLLQNVAANQAALQAKGQTPGETKQMRTLHEALVASGTAHGTNASTQRQLTQANVATINALETLMQQLFDDGKAQ